MKKKFKRTRKIVKRVVKNCLFCKQKLSPDYKEVDTLNHYLTERGKIIPRSLNGLCQKHQGQVTAAVKQARYMALLPYIVRPS